MNGGKNTVLASTAEDAKETQVINLNLHLVTCS